MTIHFDDLFNNTPFQPPAPSSEKPVLDRHTWQQFHADQTPATMTPPLCLGYSVATAHLTVMLMGYTTYNKLSIAAIGKAEISARMNSLAKEGWNIQRKDYRPNGEVKDWTKYRVNPDWLKKVNDADPDFQESIDHFIENQMKHNELARQLVAAARTAA